MILHNFKGLTFWEYPDLAGIRGEIVASDQLNGTRLLYSVVEDTVEEAHAEAMYMLDFYHKNGLAWRSHYLMPPTEHGDAFLTDALRYAKSNGTAQELRAP